MSPELTSLARLAGQQVPEICLCLFQTQDSQLTCLCMFVCIRMCLCMCKHVCGGLRCCPLGPCPPWYLFETVSLNGLELTNSARLSGKWVLEIYQFLFPLLWDYKHMSPCPVIFLWATGNQTQCLMPVQQAFYRWPNPSAPVASNFSIPGSVSCSIKVGARINRDTKGSCLSSSPGSPLLAPVQTSRYSRKIIGLEVTHTSQTPVGLLIKCPPVRQIM